MLQDQDHNILLKWK